MIKADQLRRIAAAYFSGMGYYAEISPEVPGSPFYPDVLAVQPRLKEVNLRLEKGGAPVGLIYMLKQNRWTSSEHILHETGLEQSFVYGVLQEAEENRWVKSRIEQDGSLSWSIDKYRVPASDCIMVMCAAEQPLAALEALDGLAGCYNRAYVAFPYQVHESYVHECGHHAIGVMVFNERTASFQYKLEAERQKITRHKAFASICEKAVVNHNIMI